MHSREILLLVSLWCTIIITADQHVENVAMGKKYSQISNYSTQDRPSNAANGNTSGLYDANNCIHTLPAQQGTHWWQVDLGGTYPVYNITVWGRANYWNSLNSRLYPFTITVDGQTCVSVTSAASNREHSVTCSSVMYGRVVRLNVTMPGRMLNLCEFQILVCKEGFYGLDCSSSCDTNCDGGCNRITGHCTLNVAKGKNCRQISTYHNQGAASHAADGNTDGDYTKGSCSHTAGNDPSGVNLWWEVDLGGTYPVHDITVWARDGRTGKFGPYWNDRLYPFTITVDNKTCVSMVSAPSTGRSKSVTCSSVVYGRVVRLTLERTDQTPLTLNLCEFQVFGLVCPEGFYGPNCSSPCDVNCEGGCDRTSGHCTRCKEGFWGPELCHQTCSAYCAGPTCQRDDGNCEVCHEGSYGPDCSSRCDQNCEGGCDKTGGRCTRCKPGYSGPHVCHGMCPAKCTGGTCQRATGDCNGCKRGFFGSKCTCNANCEGGCNSTNGDCTAGCKTGWWGPYHCQQSCPANCAGNTCRRADGRCNTCPNGQYGKFCTMACSSSCGQCDQDSGNCTACKDNLIFPDCTVCVDKYYKQTAPACIPCPGTCDNDTPCDKITGHCDECPPGKKGDMCNQACDGGQYGPSRCSLSCGQCDDRQQCHPVTGHCPLCEPGFYPPLCHTNCEDNTYGQNCSESCGQCKGGQSCNTTTGSCTTGCEPGYIGELCNDTCEAGLYGAECNKSCSNCQVNTTCHHQHGQCLVGCAPGFSENLCDAERTEQPYSTAFVVGVIVGVLFIVVFAAVLIVVISWCRRSREEIEENHQHVVTPVEPESTQDRDRPSSASPISDEDTTVYKIIDNNDAEKMHVQENNYESPHPYSNDDADRALYMQLSPPASDDTSKVNIELS